MDDDDEVDDDELISLVPLELLLLWLKRQWWRSKRNCCGWCWKYGLGGRSKRWCFNESGEDVFDEPDDSIG